MITYFHWGIHGWIPYVLIGALMGLLSYRRGLPMTMRSCFYPLWGKQIEGWRGDIVDILSIMCTLFGVCTSLGLGVRQLNRGLIRMDRGTFMGVDYFGGEYTSSDPMRKTACGNSDPCRRGKMGWDFNVKTQCWIVVFITLLATCSGFSSPARTSGSAPASRRASHVARWPLKAAQCSGDVTVGTIC